MNYLAEILYQSSSITAWYPCKVNIRLFRFNIESLFNNTFLQSDGSSIVWDSLW